MLVLWLVIATSAAAALLGTWSSVRALRRRRPASAAVRVLVTALAFAVTALFATAAWSLGQYHALTRETTAATLRLEPLGSQRFRARVTLPDGETQSFELAGDQVWVDAHIVKWHPWANVLGLHTAYRLDRIGGRYRSLDDEQVEPRSVRSLRDRDRPDPIVWAGARPYLAPVVDAEYGSATWADADAPGELEVRVSTSGLLMRPR